MPAVGLFSAHLMAQALLPRGCYCPQWTCLLASINIIKMTPLPTKMLIGWPHLDSLWLRLSSWVTLDGIKLTIKSSHHRCHSTYSTNSRGKAQLEWLCIVITLDDTWLYYCFAYLFLIWILTRYSFTTYKKYCEQFSHTVLVSASSASCLLHLLTTARGSTECPATPNLSVWMHSEMAVRWQNHPARPFLRVCPHHWAMRDCNGKFFFFPQSLM